MASDQPAEGARGRPGLEAPALAGLTGETRDALNRLCAQLWADAATVDSAQRLPSAHLEALADSGLYGIFAPVGEGGLGLNYTEGCAVVEDLAGGCLATALVLAQHFRFLGMVLDPATPPGLRAKFRDAAVRGRTKAGVVLTGLMPGATRLVAEPAGEGLALSGEAPWVSGWGMVDVLLVVARGPADNVVSAVLDARPQRGLSALPMRLSAANATNTVRLGFSAVRVAPERVAAVQAYEHARGQSERLRLNGSFALGVAKRCCTLVGESRLDTELTRCRESLDTADERAMPAARAAACELAVRAAHALAVARGSSSAVAGDAAERLSREAALLLVFASRPAIKAALLARLEGPGAGSPAAPATAHG